MNPIQFYLTKVAEEGAEIAQAALKASIYGLDSKHPVSQEVNATALTREWANLEAAFELLAEEMGQASAHLRPSAEQVVESKKKIQQWAVPAIQSGHVILPKDEPAQTEEPASDPKPAPAADAAAEPKADEAAASNTTETPAE